MAEYSFVTIWHLETPIQDVWDAIADVQRWPQWWSDVKTTQLEAGNESGIGRKWRFTFKSVLPYTLSFEMTVIRSEPLCLSEGLAHGELEGIGRWELSQEGAITQVCYYWNVSTTKAWMEMLAPLLRPVFAWNHNVTMRHAGEGLARYLGVKLLKIPSPAAAH
jgi:hypothetical protein